MSNIPLTRQSNLFWYFFQHIKKNCKGHPEFCLRVKYHGVCALTRSCFYVHERVRTDGHGCVRHNQHCTGHTWSYRKRIFDQRAEALLRLSGLLDNLAARKHWLDTRNKIVWRFTLRSFNCVFKILADSLRGVTTQVVFSVVYLNRNEDWSATFRFRKVLTVESTSCLGYFIYDITYLI